MSSFSYSHAQSHLLVVDDDERLRTLLQRFLTKHGYRITTAASAEDARRLLVGLEFDACVLDVTMPGEDGLSLARWIRSFSDVPILILTARYEPYERIRGLETGADDYLSKPFEPQELLLRVRNILKRTTGVSAKTDEKTLEFDAFRYDFALKELYSTEGTVPLTNAEQKLFDFFARRANEVIPRMKIAHALDLQERSIDVQIVRLRRKIEQNPQNPQILRTVRGLGYRFVIDKGATP